MDLSSLAVGLILGAALGTIATVCIGAGISAVMMRQLRAHDEQPPSRPSATFPTGNRSRGGVRRSSDDSTR